MKKIKINTPTIRLSQFLKLADLVQDGVEAKFRILDGEVKVNGAEEKRRGRKLKDGDEVGIGGETLLVINAAGEE